MVTSNQPSIYASAVTEDDGYVYPDDASEEEKDEIDEQEHEAWEDAGRPGDDDDDSDDNDDDDDDNNDDPNPYCDTDKGKAAPVCHDRKDYSQSTGLYPCNDGTNKVDWRDCKDATEKNDDNDDNGDDGKPLIPNTDRPNYIEIAKNCVLTGMDDANHGKTIDIKVYDQCPIDPISRENSYLIGYGNGSLSNNTAALPSPQKTISIETCEDLGILGGNALKFNSEIYKICNDNPTNEVGLSYYYDGFMSGCKQVFKYIDCVKAAGGQW